MISYYSKTLALLEKSYCFTRKDLSVVVKALKYFPLYLHACHFKLSMDQAPLKWICKRWESLSQVTRWLEILAEFQ